MIVPKTEALSFRLDCLNWPEAFPYKPEVDVRIWHSGDAIHLEYKVNEATVSALQCTPGGFVFNNSRCIYCDIMVIYRCIYLMPVKEIEL